MNVNMYTSVIPIIESVYTSLTATEGLIGDFFIQNQSIDIDLSSKSMASRLKVSEASLTRFAKKCGYGGYHDFILDYEKSLGATDHAISSKNIKRVLFDYQSIVDKSYSLVDDNQIKRLVKMMTEKSHLYFYGIGSSGIAATEAKSRFMRLGIKCEAVTDDDTMVVNHVVVDDRSLVIGLSISGSKEEVLDGLKAAKRKGAATALVTAQVRPDHQDYVDEVIKVASVDNLEYGNRISPQLPLLLLIDIVYDYFMEANFIEKHAVFADTLSALNVSKEKEGES